MAAPTSDDCDMTTLYMIRTLRTEFGKQMIYLATAANSLLNVTCPKNVKESVDLYSMASPNQLYSGVCVRNKR